MTRHIDQSIADAARADARRLEHSKAAHSDEPYPPGTRVTRPNRAHRMFNVRLTDEQFEQLRDLANQRHLPMSTMARSWLLQRLDHERGAGNGPRP